MKPLNRKVKVTLGIWKICLKSNKNYVQHMTVFGSINQGFDYLSKYSKIKKLTWSFV